MSSLPANALTIAEQRAQEKPPVPWIVAIVFGLIACFGACVLCLWIGDSSGYARGYNLGKSQATVLQRACPAPERQPTRFTCDTAERKHYRDVCLARIKGEI